MKKRLFAIFAAIFFILLITSNCALTFGAIATRDWYVGDELIFGDYFKYDRTVTDKGTDFASYRGKERKFDIQYTILTIDEVAKQVSVNVTEKGVFVGIYDLNYDGNEYAKNLLITSHFFTTYYTYDSNTDIVFLTQFSCGFWSYKLLEADWSFFNTKFKEIFDDDKVIKTVSTPTGTRQITVAELLDSVSYTICGRSNIINARNQFTPIRTKWTFKFDLAGAIYIYDTLEDEYVTYDKYKITYILDHTQGGTLKKCQYIREYKYETSQSIVEYYLESTQWLGGGEKLLIQLGFTIIVFSIIGFSVVAIAIIRGRKKKGK